MVTCTNTARKDTPDPYGLAMKGLCPVCGDLVRIVGDAPGGRLAGSCGDSFLASKFKPGRQPIKHFRDTRLLNNAGIEFPYCRTGGDALDMELHGWRTTGNRGNVTCLACLRRLGDA